MTRERLRLSLAASWLLAATIIGLMLTPDTAAGWLTWSVLGLATPVGLWIVSAPPAPTMSEAIHRGRD